MTDLPPITILIVYLGAAAAGVAAYGAGRLILRITRRRSQPRRPRVAPGLPCDGEPLSDDDQAVLDGIEAATLNRKPS